MDLLMKNPMIENAKKAMSPEKLEEYKKIGEYMYNTDVYKIAETGSKVQESTTQDLVMYAVQAIKSGGNPHDLSDPELRALAEVYGEKWYEKFDLEKDEIPKPTLEILQNNPGTRKLSRNQKRFLERQQKKLDKNK